MLQYTPNPISKINGHYQDSHNRNFAYGNQCGNSSQMYRPMQVPSHYEVVPAQPDKRELLMFVSDQESFCICYPNWWARTEPTPGSILFISPRSSQFQFCENISCIVEDLYGGKPTDLRDYTTGIIRQLNQVFYLFCF